MFDKQGLKNGIEHAKKNIKIFEDAIKKERDTITEYKRMMKVLEKRKDIQENMIVELVK